MNVKQEETQKLREQTYGYGVRRRFGGTDN